jgi:kynurenine formamidase
MDEVVLLSLHGGTQIDAFSHISYRGKIFNGFNTKDHLDIHGWTRAGVEKIPPVITRAIMLDVAAMKGVDTLPESYGIGPEDLQETLEQQGSDIKEGDAVLIRTGRMTLWPDGEQFYANSPGLNTAGAKWLVEQGAVLIGADNLSVEKEPNDPISVHMYLLGQAGVNLMEQLWLEDLARDQVYQFTLIVVPLKFRGGTGSPIRPLAIPQ